MRPPRTIQHLLSSHPASQVILNLGEQRAGKQEGLAHGQRLILGPKFMTPFATDTSLARVFPGNEFVISQRPQN